MQLYPPITSNQVSEKNEGNSPQNRELQKQYKKNFIDIGVMGLLDRPR